MNERSQVTWKKLCSEDRSRGRASGFTKEVAGQQKSMKKARQQRKTAYSSVPLSWLPKKWEAKDTITR
jgi:hypothetical protein